MNTRTVIQGETLVGPVRGNLRLRSYDRVETKGIQEVNPFVYQYLAFKDTGNLSEYRIAEFDCDWYEKISDEFDMRQSLINYCDLYILIKDETYTAVRSTYVNRGESYYSGFCTIKFPVCASMNALVKVLSNHALPRGSMGLVRMYDPSQRVPI